MRRLNGSALLSLAFTLGVGTGAAFAQRAVPTPLTWENIFGPARGARQSAISPDGRWVAVTATSERQTGVFLVSTDPNAPGEPKFWVEGASPIWASDSVRIVFTAQNDLWMVSRDSSVPTRLTSGWEKTRAAAVSPNGKWVAFYSTRSGSQDIWLVSTAGDATPRPLTQAAMSKDDVRFAPAWSPDSKTVAYVSNKADYWADDVWVIDVSSGNARQFSHSMQAMSTPVWSADGKSVAVLGTSKKGYWYEDLSDIYIMDAVTGAERKVRMQVHATDSLHSLRCFWSADGSQLYFIYHERGDFNLWAVPSKGGVATRITNLRGVMRSIETTGKADAFAFVHTTPTSGPDVEYLPVIGGLPRTLTHFAGQWASVVEPLDVSYRTFDGLYIQGFLYLPADMKRETRYPALVSVHGGGTNSYLRTQNLNEAYFASKGYIVLSINYRGGSGFGREFQDLSVNKWASDQAMDAAAAADFLRSLPYSNGKVGIYGYSYGGIMTMAAITRAPDKFDAAVPMAGIYDFADVYNNGDRVQKIFTKTGHGGTPEERREVYALSNSLARVQNIRTPLLIMHGEADVRAPFHQYELAVEALKKHGKQFESKSYPNEPHGFQIPADRVDMYQRAEAFLGKYLKGTAPPQPK